MTNTSYDLIIIGCGPGGYKSAIMAAQLGAKVAIIEKAQAGGTCLNQGCVPKEALIRLAKIINEVQAFDGLGLTANVKLDFEAALQHKNKLIDSIRSTITPWLKRLGITYLSGSATFINDHSLAITGVDNQTFSISATRIIIATGSRPKAHPILSIDHPLVVNSRQFMFDVHHLPKRVLCVGGGAIGCELGYVLHQFGAKVTLLEISDRLLNKPGISERASETLEKKLKHLGLDIKKQVTIVGKNTKKNSIDVYFSDGSAREYDLVLVCIGRRSNTDDLKLENAGLDMDAQGYIRTNLSLETSTHGIYAIGDVKPGPMTASAAFYDAKIAVNNALTGNQLSVNYHRVPMVIDSALQIAGVGLTEEQAEQAGFEPEVARINLAGTTKARLTQDIEGFIEIVYDDETGQLLGGCIVGPQAREMIHTVAAACQSKRGLWFFTDLNYAHPSWNEELENAIYQYVNMFSQATDPVFQPGLYALDYP